MEEYEYMLARIFYKAKEGVLAEYDQGRSVLLDCKKRGSGTWRMHFLRGVVGLFLMLFSLVSMCGAATLQYPGSAVKFYMASPKGDQPELIFSLLEPFFHKYANVPVVVESLPGKGGSYSWKAIVAASTSTTAVTGTVIAGVRFPSFLLQARQPEAMFSLSEITTLNVFAYIPLALWVPENSPFKSVADLAAKAREMPGSIAIAGSGAGTGQHIAHLTFCRASGTNMLYIPYIGSRQCIASALSGTAVAVWGYALSPQSMPGMRALAVASPQRTPVLANTPTFQELRFDVIMGEYFGVSAPTNLAEQTLRAAAEFYMTVTFDPAFQRSLTAAGIIPQRITYQDMPQALIRFESELSMHLRNFPELKDVSK